MLSYSRMRFNYTSHIFSCYSSKEFIIDSGCHKPGHLFLRKLGVCDLSIVVDEESSE